MSKYRMPAQSPDLPRNTDLIGTIRDMKRPLTATEDGFVVVGTFIDIGDPGNDPGTDEISPPFENGWENIPGMTSGFRIDELGNITVSAAVQSGTEGTAAWTMPEDYRRPYDVYILQATATPRTVAKILVQSTGEVIIDEIITIP